MIGGWLQSLQVRLALRVAALYTVAAVVVIVVLMSRAYDTARSLGDQELLLRAIDLARYVTAGENGLPRLEMPANLSAMYQPPSGRDIFAIRDANGRIIAATPPRFGALVAGWPMTTSGPVRFDVRLDTELGDFDGLSISRETVTGLVSVSVGRSSASAAALYSLMRTFIHDTIWAVSILVLAALVVGIHGIRSGLKPVRNISEMAAAIGPLAIITAALEEIEGDDDFAELKADVARMNRLVEQLLRVARLDAIVLNVTT